MSISTHSLIQPGPYAVLGFYTDSPNTTKTDRDIATTLGEHFRCHTCGTSFPKRFTPDHQPPTCIFTELPHEYQGNPLYEFEYEGWTYQTTNLSIPEKLGIEAKESTFGEKQFLYPQCKACSQKQSQVCRKMLK